MLLRLACASLLVSFGCGGNDVHHLPDAPNDIDGAVPIDGPPDAAPHGVVSITVFDPQNPGSPAVGTAVFNGPDGVVVSSKALDANGAASEDVLPGSSVTAVVPSAGVTTLQTVVAVQPGDNVRLGLEQASTSAGTFTVNFTPLAVGAGITYQVVGPCGSQTTATGTVVLGMSNTCKLDTMEIMVFATSAAGVPLGYLSKPNVAFTDGGSTTFPAATFTSTKTFNATYSNLPVEVTGVALTRDVPDGFGFSTATNMTPTGTTLNLSLSAAQPTTAFVSTRFTGPGRAQQQLIQNIDGAALAYNDDVTASLMPWLGMVALDVTTGVVTMPVTTAGTSGDAPDLSLLAISYQRPGAAAPTNFQWLVFGPTPGDFTLPTLPAALDANPKAGDTNGFTQGFTFESDEFAGYDAIRTHPYVIIPLTASQERFGGTKARVSRSPTPGLN